MGKNILLFFGIVAILSFKNNSDTPLPHNFSPNFTVPEDASKIRFEFIVDKANKYTGTVKINGTLFNDDKDAAYFLSYTCDGMQYNLKYDTARFNLFPLIQCNASYLEKVKIAPNGKINFTTYFKQKIKSNEINLQFSYFLIPPKFEIDRYERRDSYKLDEFLLSAKPQQIQ